MSFEHAITKAVNQYIQMEKDAAILELLRTGAIKAVCRYGDEWMAYAPNTFAQGATIEEAINNALKQESNLP
jgi:hypothetical protein